MEIIYIIYLRNRFTNPMIMIRHINIPFKGERRDSGHKEAAARSSATTIFAGNLCKFRLSFVVQDFMQQPLQSAIPLCP